MNRGIVRWDLGILFLALFAGLCSQSVSLGGYDSASRRPTELVIEAITSTPSPASPTWGTAVASPGATAESPVATPVVSKNTTTLEPRGELDVMRDFLKEVCTVTSLPEAKNIHARHLPYNLRERLFSALFQAQQELPLPPLQTTKPKEIGLPDCQNPQVKHLLTGQRRKTPWTVVDLPSGMGGGPELDFLELRILELQGVADLVVIGESSYNFRGDRKPRSYQINEARFEAFREFLLYLDLERCGHFLSAISDTRAKHGSRHDEWNIQNRQRQCLWKLLHQDRPNLPENTFVIFSDLDEIPNREVMLTMKHCEWKPQIDRIQLKQRVVSFNLRQVISSSAGCFPKSPWKQGALVTLPWALRLVREDKSVPLRFESAPNLEGGAMHLSHFGNSIALVTKGFQHGEGGGLLIPRWILPCQATDQDISKLLSVYRDDPISIVRGWENRSNPLPKATPSLQLLEKCHVPWALQANPERYAAFWGQPIPR